MQILEIIDILWKIVLMKYAFLCHSPVEVIKNEYNNNILASKHFLLKFRYSLSSYMGTRMNFIFETIVLMAILLLIISKLSSNELAYFCDV